MSRRTNNDRLHSVAASDPAGLQVTPACYTRTDYLWGFQYLPLARAIGPRVRPSHGVDVMTTISKGVADDKFPPSINE